MNNQLYFVAVVLQAPYSTAVRRFQHVAADAFNSKRALRSPPHVTLVPPFQADPGRLAEMTEILQYALHPCTQPEIIANGFGHFGKRVIFINIEVTEDLGSLYALLNQVLRDGGFDVKVEDRPFHPHITVAFKDLAPDKFGTAFQYFSGQACRFTCKSATVAILVHGPAGWQVVREVPVGEQ